jgi:murein DD-endopeptidase MepM/ murein hydrolase activator NlpD
MAVFQANRPEDYIENDIARRRAGFYMGIGGDAGATRGAQVIQSMMIGGTATDKMDAARAVGFGNSNGLMSGLANYNTVSQSAQMFSNLTPGAGLEGGMQATAALNQAQNVNKLRMIGIQVRDPSTGLMNNAEQVGNQIWTYLKKIKTGGGDITAKDISLSLQPGNSLDGMLTQYFGNDEVLRQGVIAFLYQKAGGGSITKSSLQQSGAMPEVAQSFGKRFSAEYGATNAYTKSGVQGVLSGNSNITDIANYFRDSVETFGGIVQAASYGQTLATGGEGAGGTLLGGVLSSAGTIIKSGFDNFLKDSLTGMFSNFFSQLGAGSILPGGGAASDGGVVAGSGNGKGKSGAYSKPSMSSRFKGGLKFGGVMALASAAMSIPGNIEATNSGQGGSAWGETAGSVAGSVAGAAIGQALIPIPVLGALIGGFAGGYLGGQLGKAVGKNFDAGDSSPLMNGLSVPENGEFGNKAGFRTQSHRGIDLVASEGTKVFAIKGGKVEKSGVEGALGNMVRIRHEDGTATVYGHLKSQLVGDGQEVREGSQIALSGNTGRSFGAHLHVALEDKDGNVSDPTNLVFGGASPTGGASGMSSGSAYNPKKLFQTSAGSLFGGTLTGSSSGTGDSSPSMSSGGGGGGTYYGGVNVTINVPQGSAVNETKLAREVKRILEDEEQLRMAVIR